MTIDTQLSNLTLKIHYSVVRQKIDIKFQAIDLQRRAIINVCVFIICACMFANKFLSQWLCLILLEKITGICNLNLKA